MKTCLQIAYTEQYEQQRGKGSFPAMITPGYKLAKQAQAHASDVSSASWDPVHYKSITISALVVLARLNNTFP